MELLSSLIYKISRLPGLSFLSPLSSSLYKINYTQRQVSDVAQTAKKLKK
jgi:hypothetical protein